MSTKFNPEKWGFEKPKKGDRYFCSTFRKENTYQSLTWNNDRVDNFLYKKGRVFKTPEEAEAATKKKLEALKGE